MIKCNSCGSISEYTSPTCPECKRRYTFSEDELSEMLYIAEAKQKARDYLGASELYRAAADAGLVRAQREYAVMLESGKQVKCDIDMAMRYFYAAAEGGGDAYCAFRYARLCDRHSEGASLFWLKLSAVLGYNGAYPALAERLSREGDEKGACYFYSLAAACDHTDAIVSLSFRYYEGRGVEKNESYAKWYMDKLTIPPIHAIKLAYRMRGIKAEEPPAPDARRLELMLRALVREATDLGHKRSAARLLRLLSDRGDAEACLKLGKLYAEGVGVKADTDEAFRLLEYAATHGIAEAYQAMGEIYLSGRLVPMDVNKALTCYRAAAKLGLTDAYEAMGDVYREGKLVKIDIPEAIRLYALAAEGGNESAHAKSEALIGKRAEIFALAKKTEREAPENAFKLYCIAVGMGEEGAACQLARCFENGIGTERDRQSAYRLYKSGAEEKDEEACFHLGRCYADGVGTERDFYLAARYLTRALRLGIVEAEPYLRRIFEGKKKALTRSGYSRAMRLIYRKKFSEAAFELEKCVPLCYGKGIYTLACLYEFGLGVPTDRKRAYELYERAFEFKFRDPRARYKLCRLKMSRAK